MILVHRLSKNSVREDTGIAAYALFTEAAIGEIRLGAEFANAPRYQLEDQDLGDIKIRVLDLTPCGSAIGIRRALCSSRTPSGSIRTPRK